MFVRRAAIAAALMAAPLAFAAPAMAQPPPPMIIDCAPCVPGSDTPIWNQIFDPAGDGNGLWEQGVAAINGGAWEGVFSSTDGVPGGGGAWERAFPNPDLE